MNMKTLLSRVLLVIWGFVASLGLATESHASDADTGLLGSTLSSVSKSHDFFSFFHLAPTGKTEVTGKLVTTEFRTGGDFKKFVAVYVTTDEKDVIRGMRLVVLRSFIDDPNKGIFAADIVKSFIGSVGAESARGSFAALSDEIMRRTAASGKTVMLRRAPEGEKPLPAEPSAAFQTYLGKGNTQTVISDSGKVKATLQQAKTEDGDALEVSLTRADS